MEHDNFQKQMCLTNKKDKIFNVRKVHYKQFDHQKCIKFMITDLKPSFSPFNLKEQVQEPLSTKINRKGGQYNYQVAIISSSTYKQLTKKYNNLKEEFNGQRQKRLEQLRIKQEQLNKCKSEKQRIDAERIKIIQRRDQLRYTIQEIRHKHEILRSQKMQRQEQYRTMNMEYLRNMIIGMRYQDNVDIDLDNMTYEELLQLEQKMGSVSKGLTQEQIEKLTKKVYKQNQPEQLCSICYYNAKDGEQMTILPCKHSFHSQCIQQWLAKEKMCPMCKQQIITKIQSSKKLKIGFEQSKQNSKQNSQGQIKSIQSILKCESSEQKSEESIKEYSYEDNYHEISCQQVEDD